MASRGHGRPFAQESPPAGYPAGRAAPFRIIWSWPRLPELVGIIALAECVGRRIWRRRSPDV